MDDHPEMRAPTPPSAPAYLIFFLSGAATLVYEVSWARQVGLLFGHTAHAAAVVLTAYFAGLAVGSAAGSALARRVRPLQGYAVAEFVAVGWACLVPLLLAAAGTDGSGFLHHPAPGARLALRWAFCFLVLQPATAALGATLPLVAEWLSPAGRPDDARVTSAYAANTLGAFVGVVGATAWLLVNVGVVGSGFLPRASPPPAASPRSPSTGSTGGAAAPRVHRPMRRSNLNTRRRGSWLRPRCRGSVFSLSKSFTLVCSRSSSTTAHTRSGRCLPRYSWPWRSAPSSRAGPSGS